MLRFICHALLSFPFVGGRGHYSFQNQFLFSDSFSIGCDYSHFSVVVLGVRLLAFLYLFSLFFCLLFSPLFFSFVYRPYPSRFVFFSLYFLFIFSPFSVSLPFLSIVFANAYASAHVCAEKYTCVSMITMLVYLCVCT